MKKNVFGRQLKRDIGQRTSLFKGLLSSLILKEKIKTTEAKAKAIKSWVDKIITKAKKGEGARNFLQRFVYKDALDKIIKDIAPRFEKRKGGYTRIIRLGERLSDKAQVVFMEWTEGARDLVLSKGQATEENREKIGKPQVKEARAADKLEKETKSRKPKNRSKKEK